MILKICTNLGYQILMNEFFYSSFYDIINCIHSAKKVDISNEFETKYMQCNKSFGQIMRYNKKVGLFGVINLNDNWFHHFLGCHHS